MNEKLIIKKNPENISIKDEEIEKLKDISSELKEQISDKRKEGYDLYLAELEYFSLPAQIKLVEATRTFADYIRCKQYIARVRKELVISEKINSFWSHDDNEVEREQERFLEILKERKKRESEEKTNKESGENKEKTKEEENTINGAVIDNKPPNNKSSIIIS